MPAEEPLAFKAGSGWPWFGQAGETPRCTPKGKVWPRISIVTASFNQGRFIEETVRSVLCQGYPNLEYIIMDGGSTDQTLKIIEKYGPLLAYWTSGKDEGSADAMDKGFQRATGEIFALINSDDVYMPYTLELIARLFEQFPDVEWITAHSTFLVDGCVVSPRRRHVEVFNQRLMQLGFNTPSFLGIPQAISTFWRSSLYRKAGGYVNKETVACCGRGFVAAYGAALRASLSACHCCHDAFARGSKERLHELFR